MIKVGDLVKRVKTLSLDGNSNGKWLLDHSISDSVGVVLEVEKQNFNIRIKELSYPECFVKVLWQTNSVSSINPMWHWGEELKVIKKTEENT